MIPFFVEAGLRALLVAIAVGAGLRFLRVRDVRAQKVCWGLVLVAAFFMPTLMHSPWLPTYVSIRLPLPIPRPERPWHQAGKPGDALLNSASKEQPLESGGRYPAPVISQSDFERSQDSAVQNSRQVSQSVWAQYEKWFLRMRAVSPQSRVIWLAAIVIWTWLLARLLVGTFMALKLWLAATPLEFDSARSPISNLSVRSSPAVFSPVTIGSGVILPENYFEWSEEKLRIVLAHERSHVRQGDFYLQLFAELYAALFWFSPLGWWLKRKLSDLGEAISDRAGLDEAVNRASYAQILLEFAAMPRSTQIGVAMARTSNLSRRIERLLNDSTFLHAFATSRLGLVVAILLVPIALFASTGLLHVEAAAGMSAAQAAPQSSDTVQGSPSQSPQAPNRPAVEPAQQAVPASPSKPDTTELSEPPLPPAPAAPEGPEVQTHEVETPQPPSPPMTAGHGSSWMQSDTSSSRNGHGYSYSYSSNGDSYVLVTDASGRITFSGDWNDKSRASVDRARQIAHGKFLWFSRNGKSYFIDDPALIAQIEAMYKPMEELGRQQEELGRRQEELGKEQEKLGRDQEQVSIPAPDITKEIAELNAAMAKLQSLKGSSISREQLADLQGKIGEMQGRLGELQGKFGEKQGNFGALQGKLGEQQGKLGAEQGRLGAEQGRIAAEADQKTKSIISESLNNGKAKPLE